MVSFESDYTEGTHPAILERLLETNLTQTPGYGHDAFSESARQKIKVACGSPDAEVTFLTGGTQTNQIVIDTMLKPYEGVVAVQSGHVNVHEAGAIEYTGHKVITLPGHDGKMDAAELDAFIRNFYADKNHEHMVSPGMAYISYPTEYGTLYSKEELNAISAVCRSHHIPLFIDGARLGYGLAASYDVTLLDIAQCADVFYIGGTKVGALCGEALVFAAGEQPPHFESLVKQHGALLAKGRLLGVQFDVLFTDNLYFKISTHAVALATRLKDALKAKGYRLFIDSPTNQQFVILENAQLETLRQQVAFGFWEKYDETHTVVRFATSWATTDTQVDQLIALL
ncbi:MAG: aminotransferase class I/II-fold pyridoxal phosphate-dependent enzyme [Treponema sp.]|nr:aminotransferase class I/II-fold pyridoxal phosphate-dependent enzyme [Treponema sp.]